MILIPFECPCRDEYKEFEKLIQEDLREVDDRLEEEEVIDHYFSFAIFSTINFNLEDVVYAL